MIRCTRARILYTACMALLTFGPLAPAIAADNPFLSAASKDKDKSSEDRTQERKDKEQDKDAETGGGWGAVTDEDPMEPDPDADGAKCGRCFGGGG